MRVEVIEPHGFCSGVRAAVEKARHALSSTETVWCLHDLVHNETVVDELRAKGMRFVESLADVPDGATVLFSAHGVPPAVRSQAAAKRLRVIDATCPFVARAHRQVQALAARGVPVVIVGHAAHVEVLSLAGECRNSQGMAIVKDVMAVSNLPFPKEKPIGVVCQTTVSSGMVDTILAALRARYPHLLESPASEICTATRDRQRAVRDFVCAGDPAATGVLVIGGANSSNTARLVEIAREVGAHAWRIGDPFELSACDFADIVRLGVTAGASTPESTVRDVAAKMTLFTAL